MFEGLLQPMHLLVILIIALLVFGPKKLPEIGKSLGAGIRGFKDGITDQATPKQDTPESKTIASEDSSPKS